MRHGGPCSPHSAPRLPNRYPSARRASSICPIPRIPSSPAATTIWSHRPVIMTSLGAHFMAGDQLDLGIRTLLASDDVLDVIGEERLRVLWKAAVFAAMIGTFTDGLP